MTDSWWVKNARDLGWTPNLTGDYCPRAPARAGHGGHPTAESSL